MAKQDGLWADVEESMVRFQSRGGPMSSRIAAGLPPLKRTPGKTGAPGVGTKNLQKASHTEKSKNFENGIEREGQLGGKEQRTATAERPRRP